MLCCAAGGEFLGYFPDDLLFRWRPAGPYDAAVEQRTAYTFDPHTGDSRDQVSTDVYDPRERGWYQDALAKCTSDLLNVYTCALHWTAPFVFKSDGNLGITPALGFLDHAGGLTGAPLGVTAYGFKLSAVSTILADAVQGKANMVAYIMERDGGLIAVSNGDPVTIDNVRINAKDSTDSMIATSAALVVDQHYRSDQTLLLSGELITIKRFEKDDQLEWFIVVVEPYDPAATGGEQDCIIALEADMLAIARGEIDLFLTNLIEAGDLVTDALSLGLIPSYSPPAAIDEAFGIQDYMFATLRNCDVTRMMYVGYVDGTFLAYHNFDHWSSFRGGDASGDTTRYYYHIDEFTGETSSGAFKTSTTYDPRTRPWYQHAEQLGEGSFSPIFTFATSNGLGLTYSVPFYEGDPKVFRGVVGVDFELKAVDAILSAFSEPGFGIFLFENEETSADDAYDMVASSTNVVVANSTRQHKAYDAAQVENYHISSVSKHLYDNNIVHDWNTVDLDSTTAEILNYNAWTLNWRLVSYNIKVNDAIGASSSTSSEDDDEITAVLGLASASFVLLVVVLALVVAVLVLAKKEGGASAAASSSSSGNDASITKNPIGADTL
jgi:hypothetical protein